MPNLVRLHRSLTRRTGLVRAAAAGIALLALSTTMALGANYIGTAGPGTWNSGSSWVGGTIPNGVGASAVFSSPTGARTTTLDANITIGSLTLTNNTSNLSEINQGTSVNGLTFNNGGTSTITVLGTGSGQNRLNADMIVQDQLTIDVQNTTTPIPGAFSLLGSISGPGGVTKNGDGLMTLAFVINTTDRFKTFTGPTILNGGRTRMSVGARPTATSSFTINAGAQLTPIGSGVYDFGAPGTVLTLNSLGPTSGPFAVFPGAIRPDTNLAVVFTNPIVLAGDSLVHSNGASAGSITFTNVISGPGKLILNQPAGDANNGKYILTNAGNTYLGGTTINGGTVDATTGNLGSTSGALTVNVQAFTGAQTTLLLNTSAPTTVGSLSGTKNGTPTNSAVIDNGGQLLTVNQTTAGTYEGNIIGAGGFTLGPLSTSTLTLTGTNTLTGTTTLSAGTLQSQDGVGLSAASFLSLDGGVLQGNGVNSFTRSLGTSGSKVQWTANGGGFSANGGQMTVNLGGAGAEVGWGSNVGSQIVGTLQFGSASANNKTLFVNGINLNSTGTTGLTRTVNVTSGTGNDFAEISGVIRNSGAAAGLTKTGSGRLVLTGSNTFTGTTTISGGTLQANDGVGLPTNSFLSLDGGILQGNGTSTFTRSLGTSGSKVQWTANGGGFSANGGQMTVNLGGAGAEVGWGTTVGSQIVGTLQFGSASANDKTVFVNGIDLNNTVTTGLTRTINVASGTGNDSAEVSGVIRNSGAAANLTKTGSGTLALTGANTFTGVTTINAGKLKLAGAGSIASSPTITVKSGATLDVSQVSSGANYDGTRFALQSGQKLQGNGTVTGPVSVLAGAIVAPGESVGALSTGTLDFKTTTSALNAEIEFGATPAADLIMLTGTMTLANSTLNLSFANAPALLAPTTFLLVSNDGNDAITGTFGILTNPVGYSVSVDYAFNGTDSLGRVGNGNDLAITVQTFVAAVPEPATIIVWGLTIVGLIAGRKQFRRLMA